MMKMSRVMAMACCLAVAGGAAAARLENSDLRLDFNETTAAFSVTDRRTGRVWEQLPDAASGLVGVRDVTTGPTNVSFSATNRHLAAAIRVDVLLVGATVRVELDAPHGAVMDYGREVDTASGQRNPAPKAIYYPYPFALKPKDRTLWAHGSGFAFPADQLQMGEGFPEHMKCYTHDFKMAMWGCYSERMLESGEIVGADGFLAVIETPWNSFGRYTVRANGLRQFDLGWIQDMRTWGHRRAIRFEFMPACGPMAIAARYRAEMDRRGYLATYAKKAARRPAMKSKYERIAQAPSVWYWAIDGDKPGVCRQLREDCGFRDFLFQFANRPDLGTDVTAEQVAACAKAVPGVLLSEYDIYKDTMDRENLPKIDYVRPYWCLEAVDNDDIVQGANGDRPRGWGVQMKGTTDPKHRIGCLSICERTAAKYAFRRIGERLREAPDFSGRYLDVTGQYLSECWHPRHRVNLRESVKWRTGILEVVNDYGLLAASEDGLECFVPCLDYLTCGFSGPGGYRGPDGGRHMWVVYEDDPPDSVRRGTDEQTRVPIWEMVFHDCVTSYWDWCDYNNKWPRIWWKRDLFNAVCGTPPLYFFDRKTFPRFKKDLRASYLTANGTAMAAPGARLTAYRFLTPDRRVQRSEWDNGVVCTVNFGETSFRLADGRTLPPHGCRLDR